ncbi:uncharacterized protein ISCGN_025203 [Ixodes scapularis]
MFAHVRYVEDNLKAVVSVTLIRNFSPKSVSDYDKAHLYETYWRSPQGTEEGYYSALILQMEESKEDMIQNLLKSRGTALPVIFEDPKTAIQATHAISRKEKALAQKVARKKEMKAILGKRRQVALSETSDDDDEELVPRKLLTIEKQANAQLEKELERVRGELAASRKELEEERKLRTALSWTLLSKFDDDGLHIAKARPPQQANVSTLGALPNISTPLAGKKTATHKPQGLDPASARPPALERRLLPTNHKGRQLQVEASSVSRVLGFRSKSWAPLLKPCILGTQQKTILGTMARTRTKILRRTSGRILLSAPTGTSIGTLMKMLEATPEATSQRTAEMETKLMKTFEVAPQMETPSARTTALLFHFSKCRKDKFMWGQISFY